MDHSEIIKALEQQIETIRITAEEQINALNKSIASFRVYQTNSTNNSVANKTTSNTNTDASDRQKIANVIKAANRFLKVREIAVRLNELEPKISVEEWLKKCSPTLSFLKKSAGLTKYMVGTSNQNTFWGSKTWLDEDGKIKPEHMYDETQVQNRGEKIEI